VYNDITNFAGWLPEFRKKFSAIFCLKKSI
jgi:hypothetical protein